MRRVGQTMLIGLGLLAFVASIACGQDPYLGDLDSIPEELSIIDGGASRSTETNPPGTTDDAPVESGFEPFVLPVDGPPAPVVSTGTTLNNGWWYAEADAVFMERSTLHSLRLATDATVGSDRSLKISKSQGFAVPVRLTLGRYLARDYENRDYMLEFSFFGLGTWESSGSVQAVTDNFLINAVDPFIGGFNGSDQQRFHYRSEFENYEVNYRIRWRLPRDRMVLEPNGQWVREINPGHLASILFGVRFYDLDEYFDYTSRSTIPAQRRGSLATMTSNNLYGVQTGGELIYQQDRWSLGVRGKAGVYLNSATQESSLRVVDIAAGDVSRDDHATDEAIAFLGEVSAFARFHIRPNFAFRVAYESMYVNTVALAPAQINFDLADARIRLGGQEMYQGFSLGFEATW